MIFLSFFLFLFFFSLHSLSLSLSLSLSIYIYIYTYIYTYRIGISDCLYVGESMEETIGRRGVSFFLSPPEIPSGNPSRK